MSSSSGFLLTTNRCHNILIANRHIVGKENGDIEMRVVKKAEERRNEILNAADELFRQKGFDGTSTKDIIEMVGIARGTLYHHFKSKEDIMDGLINRYNDRLLKAAKEIAKDKSIPAIERIIRVVMAVNLINTGGTEVMDHLHKPQNALMHQKIQKSIINKLTPILADIIRDGIEGGIFKTPYPYETMEMALAYTNTVFDNDMVEMNKDERKARIQAFIFNIERMLGVESGGLKCFNRIFDIENEA